MNVDTPRDGLQLRSIVKDSGELELSLARVATPAPAADEVVLRVEATPINPSDIGLLFGAERGPEAKASSWHQRLQPRSGFNEFDPVLLQFIRDSTKNGMGVLFF